MEKMARPITASECAVLEWLLDHASTRDVTAYRNRPLDQLVVVPGCQCGCASLDFTEHAWGGATMIADALAVYPDGQMAGLILWGKGGEIVSLEVYDCHPKASHRVPEVAYLKPA